MKRKKATLYRKGRKDDAEIAKSDIASATTLLPNIEGASRRSDSFAFSAIPLRPRR